MKNGAKNKKNKLAIIFAGKPHPAFDIASKKEFQMKINHRLCYAGIRTCPNCGEVYYGTNVCPVCGKKYKEE